MDDFGSLPPRYGDCSSREKPRRGFGVSRRARAHAHAGVLVTPALVGQIFADAAS